MYIIIISTLLNFFFFSLSAQNLPFSPVFLAIDFWYLLPLDCVLGLRLQTVFRTYYAHRFVYFLIIIMDARSA